MKLPPRLCGFWDAGIVQKIFIVVKRERVHGSRQAPDAVFGGRAWVGLVRAYHVLGDDVHELFSQGADGKRGHFAHDGHLFLFECAAFLDKDELYGFGHGLNECFVLGDPCVVDGDDVRTAVFGERAQELFFILIKPETAEIDGDVRMDGSIVFDNLRVGAPIIKHRPPVKRDASCESFLGVLRTSSASDARENKKNEEKQNGDSFHRSDLI